ncbi:hypothetical protein ACQEU3_27345 [Spirillospora sp. CA-253888]
MHLGRRSAVAAGAMVLGLAAFGGVAQADASPNARGDRPAAPSALSARPALGVGAGLSTPVADAALRVRADVGVRRDGAIGVNAAADARVRTPVVRAGVKALVEVGVSGDGPVVKAKVQVKAGVGPVQGKGAPGHAAVSVCVGCGGVSGGTPAQPVPPVQPVSPVQPAPQPVPPAQSPPPVPAQPTPAQPSPAQPNPTPSLPELPHASPLLPRLPTPGGASGTAPVWAADTLRPGPDGALPVPGLPVDGMLDLPLTGTEALPLAGLGLAAVLAGGTAIAVTRRRARGCA